MLSTTILCMYFIATVDVCNTYKQIIKNHSNIELRYAKTLSELIVDASNRYHIKPHIYAAILMQESRYNLKAVNRVSKDYGIAQININTINAFKLSKERLLTDLKYSINSGAAVLSDFRRRHEKKEKWYWTRYNASNPVKRTIYKQRVLRYL